MEEFYTYKLATVLCTCKTFVSLYGSCMHIKSCTCSSPTIVIRIIIYKMYFLFYLASINCTGDNCTQGCALISGIEVCFCLPGFQLDENNMTNCLGNYLVCKIP